MSVHSGHSGHSGHSTQSEYIDIKAEKHKLHRLKKCLDRQQQQLNDQRKEFSFQIEQYKLQKNKIEILQQTVQKLKSELSKVKKEKHAALNEIQTLKQQEFQFKMTKTNYVKKLRHSRKETLNIKKRLKLALTDMDKQSKYYEQKIKQTEHNTAANDPLPQRISLINETSKDIDFQFNKNHGLLVNIKYKPQKAPTIRKSMTSPITAKFQMDMLSPISASPTPSPSTDSNNSMNSPREAYGLYVHRIKQNGKVPKMRPKLIK